MRKANTMRKFITIRNTMFGFDIQWASDGYWQQTLKNGDRCTDIVSMRLLKRDKEPRLLVSIIGPLLIALMVCSADSYSK
jgi:hypothetical protein